MISLSTRETLEVAWKFHFESKVQALRDAGNTLKQKNILIMTVAGHAVVIFMVSAIYQLLHFSTLAVVDTLHPL